VLSCNLLIQIYLFVEKVRHMHYTTNISNSTEKLIGCHRGLTLEVREPKYLGVPLQIRGNYAGQVVIHDYLHVN
jgi:hypothetical protein